MNGPYPGNWQSTLRGVAATAVLVAIGFYIAIHLIEAVAKPLIGIGLVVAVLYAITRLAQHRRSRW